MIRPQSMKNMRGEMIFLASCVLFLSLGSVGILGAKIKCGQTSSPAPLFSGLEFLFTWNPKVFGINETAGCYLDRGEALVAILLVIIVITAGSCVGLYFWARYKESDECFIKDLARRKGIAQRPEIKNFISTKTVIERGKNVRPSIKHPKPSDVETQIGRSAGSDIWVSSEDSVVIMGPPRSGKGFHLIIADIIDSPGAVMTTSTRGDNYAATAKLRAAKGPVMLFDPQGLSGVESNLKWSPFQGCEIPETADRRADILVSASGCHEISYPTQNR